MALEGLSTVLQNLHREIEGIRTRTKVGLTESGLVVKADSVRETPIDLGNLRGSAYVMVTDNPPDTQNPSFTGDDAGRMSTDHQTSQSEMKALVDQSKIIFTAIIGYSAFYALFVHEAPPHYNLNQGTRQYLLRSLMKNRSRILSILAKHARL